MKMEAIKKNRWAKLTAFLLLLVLAVITFFSAIVVIQNVDRGWYSKSEQSIQLDMYHETAFRASTQIMDLAIQYEPSGDESGPISVSYTHLYFDYFSDFHDCECGVYAAAGMGGD